MVNARSWQRCCWRRQSVGQCSGAVDAGDGHAPVVGAERLQGDLLDDLLELRGGHRDLHLLGGQHLGLVHGGLVVHDGLVVHGGLVVPAPRNVRTNVNKRKSYIRALFGFVAH